MAVRSKRFSDLDATSAGWREITPTSFEVAQPAFYDFEKQKVAYQCGDSAMRIEYSNDALVRGAAKLPLQANDVSRRIYELTSVQPEAAAACYSNGELGKVPCGPWSATVAQQIAPDRVTAVICDLSIDTQQALGAAIVPGGFSAASPTELLNRLGVPTQSFEAAVASGGRLQGAKAQLETSAQVLELWRSRVTDGETLLRALHTELQSVVTSLQIFWNTGRLMPPAMSVGALSTAQARLDREVESAEESLAQAKASLADARAAYDAARTAYEVILRGSMR